MQFSNHQSSFLADLEFKNAPTQSRRAVPCINLMQLGHQGVLTLSKKMLYWNQDVLKLFRKGGLNDFLSCFWFECVLLFLW